MRPQTLQVCESKKERWIPRSLEMQRGPDRQVDGHCCTNWEDLPLTLFKQVM